MLLYLTAAVLAVSVVRVSGSYAPYPNPEYATQATRCAEKLFESLDKLARYYCRSRYILTSEDAAERGYDPYSTLDTIETLSECAYGSDYNFLHGELPIPLNNSNAEADKMMIACLAQQAAYRYLTSSPDITEGADALMCPSVALRTRIFDPFAKSAVLLHTLDFQGLLDFPDRPPCLAAVLSSFARDSVYLLAEQAPPPKPSAIDEFFHQKPPSHEFHLSSFKPGLEWPIMMQTLKDWAYGDVIGLGIEEYSDNSLPKITVYYKPRS